MASQWTLMRKSNLLWQDVLRRFIAKKRNFTFSLSASPMQRRNFFGTCRATSPPFRQPQSAETHRNEEISFRGIRFNFAQRDSTFSSFVASSREFDLCRDLFARYSNESQFNGKWNWHEWTEKETISHEENEPAPSNKRNVEKRHTEKNWGFLKCKKKLRKKRNFLHAFFCARRNASIQP